MFKILTRILIKINFRDVFIEGDYISNHKPLLVLANHISWWDGFFIMFLNLKLLKLKFHFMMLEEQLKKHWYFQYSGGFSIKKKSHSILETIDYAAKLLSSNENMVLLFPQGKINSIYKTYIKFERGIEYILKKSPDNVDILFVVNLIDYFSHARPSLYMFIKTIKITYKEVTLLEKEYNKFYTEVIYKHITQK